MKFCNLNFCLLFVAVFLVACNDSSSKTESSASGSTSNKKGTYAYDADFLKKHTDKVLELSSADESGKILLSGDYQGRVMTSTATGDSGLSFGWLNYDLISSGEWKKQFNPVGGEERFWLGPEGGQYSVYFKQGDSFNINHWQVPALIDTVSYDLVQSNNTEAVFIKKASITNYSGTTFDLNIERKITMLDKQAIESKLKATLPADVRFVGYQTENRLQNVGDTDWTKDKGLLSIWLLGMFTPTPKTMVIIPYEPVKNARSYITDSYFGPIPGDRLQVKDSVLFFVCDGKYRSKIGLSPVIAKPIAAGFDFQNNVLTIVIPEINKSAPYVNSKWELQKEPYKGDVINSYNDGPLENGEQMGPFYEIESSSPALELKKGQAATYRQATLHLQGNYQSLRELAKNLLAVDLDTIKR
jgi:hypothetical protein